MSESHPGLRTLPKIAFAKDGILIRPDSQFRSFISNDAGSRFPPEKGRYHLYVSYACPWAHRTLIVRKLKGLEDFISVSCVHYRMSMTTGWRFATADEDIPGEDTGPDPLHDDVKYLQDLYFKVDPDYKGRFTVPLLWDKTTDTAVNNESSEIIRMMNTEFNSLLPEEYQKIDLYPEPQRMQIDDVNKWHYDNINNGVYKTGVAQVQDTYTKAVTAVFESLDLVERHLASSSTPYYFGNQITEVDVRLFVTIVRFDPVYVGHFKCNIRDIRSGYPAIHRWLRKLYWDVPAFQDTTQFEHIKRHYMESHEMINPFSVVSVGPLPNILKKENEVAAVNPRGQAANP